MDCKEVITNGDIANALYRWAIVNGFSSRTSFKDMRKECGIESRSTISKDTYKIINAKKFLIAKIKYGF